MSKKKPVVYLRRKGSTLFPATEYDAEIIQSFTSGADIEATLHQRRSVGHMRKYWVILQALVGATGQFANKDALDNAVKMTVGLTKVVPKLRGVGVDVLPDSISFDKMNQADFNVYFEKAIEVLSDHFGIDVTTLRNLANGAKTDMDR